MKPLTRVLLVLLAWAGTAMAQDYQAPPLTGRVVDRAEMLDPAAEARLTRMLAGHEDASGEQVVVVTLPDLQGRTIEEVGLQLGRQWGIGEKGKDTGALLVVARDERRIRIEVGYGLEGRLTDAESSLIINRIMVPAFREGAFERGIVEGAAAMVQVLGGDPLATPASATQPLPMRDSPEGGLPVLFFFLMLVVMFLVGGRRGRRGGVGRAVLAGALLGGMGRGGGGGFGGGGFGGGGGGFGGGGASGGW